MTEDWGKVLPCAHILDLEQDLYLLLVSRKHIPHKCLEVLDTLQSFRVFFVQP